MPASQMLQFLSSYAPPQRQRRHFTNPQVDAWINAAEEESGPEKRKELYCQIAKQVWNDAPWLFLWVQHFPIVYAAKVTGVSSLPNEKFERSTRSRRSSGRRRGNSRK